jgi:hypothetical protein
MSQDGYFGGSSRHQHIFLLHRTTLAPSVPFLKKLAGPDRGWSLGVRVECGEVCVCLWYSASSGERGFAGR